MIIMIVMVVMIIYDAWFCLSNDSGRYLIDSSDGVVKNGS